MIIRLEGDQFKRSTSTTVIARLADHFGVSVEEILGELPDDHVPDLESMLRRAGGLDARDRVLLNGMIGLMVEMQASRDQRARQISGAIQQGGNPKTRRAGPVARQVAGNGKA